MAAAVGVAASLMLALSFSSTYSSFLASITNSTNTAGTGALIMQEQNSGGTVTCLSTDGGTVSTNTSTCSTINKFGGSLTMVPGTAVATPVTIKNNGTVAANTFTLTPGATCTQSTNGTSNGTATDLCAKMNIVIVSGSTTVYTGTLAGLAGHAAFPLTVPVAAGTTIPFTFTVTLDASAGNTYEGLAASIPLTWTFTS